MFTLIRYIFFLIISQDGHFSPPQLCVIVRLPWKEIEMSFWAHFFNRSKKFLSNYANDEWTRRKGKFVNYTWLWTQLKTFSHSLAATDLIAIIQFHNSYASKQGGRRHWTKIYTGTQIFIIIFQLVVFKLFQESFYSIHINLLSIVLSLKILANEK